LPEKINVASDERWLTLPLYAEPLDRYDFFLELSESSYSELAGTTTSLVPPYKRASDTGEGDDRAPILRTDGSNSSPSSSPVFFPKASVLDADLKKGKGDANNLDGPGRDAPAVVLSPDKICAHLISPGFLNRCSLYCRNETDSPERCWDESTGQSPVKSRRVCPNHTGRPHNVAYLVPPGAQRIRETPLYGLDHGLSREFPAEDHETEEVEE
jgi:hypothetical protein